MSPSDREKALEVSGQSKKGSGFCQDSGGRGDKVTPEQILNAEVELWFALGVRPGSVLTGHCLVVSNALRAYADLLAKQAAGDALVIERDENGKWSQLAIVGGTHARIKVDGDTVRAVLDGIADALAGGETK